MGRDKAKTHMTRGDLEVKIVKLKRGRGDVDTEEGGRVAIEDLDRRIQG